MRANLGGRSVGSAITQTPASAPFAPLTTPPMSFSPILTDVACCGCCAPATPAAASATAAKMETNRMATSSSGKRGRSLRRSAALEVGLSLLVEGANAFAPVVGVDEAVVGLDLEAIAGQEIGLHPVVDRFLRLPHGKRRVVGDGPRRVERVRDQGPRLADSVHEAPLGSLFGGDSFAGEDELLRPALAHRTRQVLRAAAARHDAEAHFGER